MENQETTENCPPTIKHIVCSGGGLAGLVFYGALKESHARGIWQLENIETIYGTSVGSIIAVILALKYDWETLDDYLIKRPWQTVFTFNLYSIMDTINNQGMYGMEIIQDIFLPLFSGKDVRMDITLKDFYELTKIEIHMFCTNMNSFELTDISYKTHPEWSVIEAIYSSCAVPVLFTPFFKRNECYCDGGLIANYPIAELIRNGSDPNETLGIKYKGSNSDETSKSITTKTTLVDYTLTIISRLIGRMLDNREPYKLAYEYDIWCPSLSISDLIKTTTDDDLRRQLIMQGVEVVSSK